MTLDEPVKDLKPTEVFTLRELTKGVGDPATRAKLEAVYRRNLRRNRWLVSDIAMVNPEAKPL
ncbi:hypothetical protein ATK74_3044 [Propionicimonas paludicola]|uniref:Uncharacterized protein n=1 Tax=Propionicimonas paludicola TaxID=185243 RepID=A0A2A9CVL1_9ACTN|nr:hypothetical protein [Propionicimonas paludicola]PFG15496.1 hypothetical protein ATK74_0014 [Propionicimonas paludicola]PFG18454.1 hypothetical protein ATK74_3044 [Propionicimonas paludicola]